MSQSALTKEVEEKSQRQVAGNTDVDDAMDEDADSDGESEKRAVKELIDARNEILQAVQLVRSSHHSHAFRC